MKPANRNIQSFSGVEVNYKFDDGPGRYRIGCVIPAEDAVSERDFRLMAPSGDIAVFTSRVATTKHCTNEELRKMEPLLGDAVALLLPGDRIDVIAFNCTSATIAIGYHNIDAIFREHRLSIPCVTPVTAAIAALEALKVKTISILTPYPDDVNNSIFNYFQNKGIFVKDFKSFHLDTDYEVSRIPPRAIYEAGLAVDLSNAEAIFISCTGIRAAEIADQLEQAIGKPVITSNQAAFWQCLRFAGYMDPVLGFGKLLTL